MRMIEKGARAKLDELGANLIVGDIQPGAEIRYRSECPGSPGRVRLLIVVPTSTGALKRP
jgi:hypothetical protein